MPIGEMVTILLADDDRDDQLLTREALREAQIINQLHCVGDGEELLAYLRNEGPYNDTDLFPEPGIVLLDLNMPRMDGRAALKVIKNDPKLRHIPVVILSTSQADEDIISSYRLGSNSFITKPTSFDRLVETLKKCGEYWMGVVQLPIQIQT